MDSEERRKLFKAAIDESYSLWRKKDNENAFRAVSKANLYISPFTDQLYYLLDLVQVKRMSARICASDKNPNYEAYLIFYLEDFAIGLAADLSQFPFDTHFRNRKKHQDSPYDDDGSDSSEISPNDSDMDIALKKLKLFKNRHQMFEEFLNFVYNELPEIYGIPSEYNEEKLKQFSKLTKENYHEWQKIYVEFPEELRKRDISLIPYEIHNFIVNLLTKYYDLGNQ